MPTPPFAPRPATPADAPALAELARAAYARHARRVGREPAPMTADYAAAVAHHEVWMIEDGTGAAALLVLVPASDHVLLENVTVHPRAQGRGHGAALLELARRRARELGVDEVRLYTNEAMTANIAWYARHGFRETHRAVDGGFRRVFMTCRPS